MIAVLKKVNLWQFLETQDGLQTKLAEKAGNLSNVTKSDCIYFMEDGKVREKGTHRELMEKNGAYRRLYESQMKLENYGISDRKKERKPQ